MGSADCRTAWGGGHGWLVLLVVVERAGFSKSPTLLLQTSVIADHYPYMRDPAVIVFTCECSCNPQPPPTRPARDRTCPVAQSLPPAAVRGRSR